MKMTSSSRLNLRLQSFTTGLLLAVILALLAIGLHRYQVRWDWTATKRHTLAEQSVAGIKQFKEPLQAIVFAQEGSDPRASAQELLDKYQVVNPQLTVRYVDPDQDPAAARREEVATYGTVVIRSGEKREKITELTEEAVTNALIRLSKGTSKSIRFLVGHGEHPLPAAKTPGAPTKDRNAYGIANTLLKGEGYDVTNLDLAGEEKVPEGTTVIVMAGPRKPLLPIELSRLISWLDQGGRLLVMNDPETKTGLEEYLGQKGVELLPGLVIDPAARLFGGGPTIPLVNQYHPQHPITKGLNVASFFPEARSLLVKAQTGGKAIVTPLLNGAERGWLETSPVTDGKVTFDEGQDTKGPLLLGVAIEEGKVRLVVTGDSDFAADAYIDASGNSEVFLNILRWLAEDENFIAIKPKETIDANLTLTRDSGVLLTVGLLVVIPLMLLVTGGVIWVRRRNR